MELIPIIIQSRSTGEKLGQVDLPSFCIMHMKSSSAATNAHTMKSYIEKKCGGLTIQAMFIGDRDISNQLDVAQLEKGDKGEIVITVIA
jgi:hypothetical protein